MSRRQLFDATEDGVRSERAPELENFFDHLRIEFAVDAGIAEDRLDFGSEEQRFALYFRIEQWPHADAVSGEEKAFAVAVPNGDGPLAIHSFEAGGAVSLEQMENDFGIG